MQAVQRRNVRRPNGKRRNGGAQTVAPKRRLPNVTYRRLLVLQSKG